MQHGPFPTGVRLQILYLSEIVAKSIAIFISKMTSSFLSLYWLVVITCFTAVRCRAQDVNSSTGGSNDTLDTSARTLLEVLPESTTTGKYGPDAIPVGNYTLLGCGPSTSGSKADHLKLLLPVFLSQLRLVIADTRMGISGFHGYRTFFKESAIKESVEAVFQNIQIGSAVHLQTRGGDVVRTPKIVCLGEDEDEAHVTGIGNLYEFYCTGNFGLDSPAAQFRRTELVVLCPSFFQMNFWPSLVACPKKVNGQWSPDGTSLIQNQFAILTRALSGLYIPRSRQAESTRLEGPASLQSVADWPASKAVGSIDSYAYYAAGKCFVLSTFEVYPG